MNNLHDVIDFFIHDTSSDRSLKGYLSLYYIRSVELAISDNYSVGIFRCPVHLSIGQEAIATGTCIDLLRTDLVISTHRSHAHYLAKGGNLNSMFAEMMGNLDGCAGGRGGSMHLLDEASGFFGSIPIVGSSLPIATGLAYAEKQSESGNLVVAFVGDAVLETGAFFESLNLAGLKQLPLLIVIEDNGYSTFANKSVRVAPQRDVRKLVDGFGLGFLSANGNDFEVVQQVVHKVTSRVRLGFPYVLEFKTFRPFEHCGPNRDDHLGYRAPSEVQSFDSGDPVKIQRERVIETYGENFIAQAENHISSFIQQSYLRSKENHLLQLQDLEMDQ